MVNMKGERALLATRRKAWRLIIMSAAIGLFVVPADGVGLKEATAAAFARYTQATEQRMENDLRSGSLLVVDRLEAKERQKTYTELREGRIYIERLETKVDGKTIEVPDGLIHHWVGLAYIPSATIAQTLAILQNYENQKSIYKPDVRDSKLLESDGNEFKVYLQLYSRSLVTVVENVNLDVHYSRPNTNEAVSKSYSTRIAEVENWGKPDEHELPVGNDHGYLWRLCSYWVVEEKDRGVYVQVESVGLTRTIPWAISWLINPLTKKIPGEVLSRLLDSTRTAVTTYGGLVVH